MWRALAERLGKGVERLLLRLQRLVAVAERVLLDQLELVAGHLVRGRLELGQQLVEADQAGRLRRALGDGLVLQERETALDTAARR